MYIPPHFREESPGVLHEIIRRYSFATLISQNDGLLIASQLPFLFDPDRNVLRSHMARPNPQWHQLEEREVLVIFQGPHAYVTPSWYTPILAVPTWNYVTAHVYGTARLIEDKPGLQAIVTDTVLQYESDQEHPWVMSPPGEFMEKMLNGIMGFEIAITRIEGTLKLSQNRSAGDVQGVRMGLSSATNSVSHELSEWMGRVKQNPQAI